MSDDFVHLHTHSDMSQLDGAGRIDDYVKTARLRGNIAIAFTDHGTMRGLMREHEQCAEVGIKPIYGCEFYVSPNMRRRGISDEERADLLKGVPRSEQRDRLKEFEEREGIRDRWHLGVWARDQEGLKNLYRLSSAAFIDGFYYKPRIDINELAKYSEGLSVSTGCLSSPINDQWVIGKKRAALEFADRLHELFGENMHLEIQPHAIREQRTANQLMLKLRDRYDGKSRLLATQDAHYVEQSDAVHHEVLLCIGTGSNMSDPNRFKFDGDEFHMRTRKQMRRAFKRHHEFLPSQLVKEALDATVEFAERCDATIEVDYHKALLPDPGLPKKYRGNHTKFFIDLCIQGWSWRNVPARAEAYANKHGISAAVALELYKARLKHEMAAIKNQGFVKYFLIVRDIYQFARDVDIMFGPGRGSVGGSLVAYLMGFTIVDPIEHGLIFERFINPFRVDEPDVDMDFEDARRGEIIEYLVRKYGRDKVAQIATIGKLSGKQCLTDVSRVLEVPLPEVRKVTASIIERSSGDERASQTIEDSFKEFDVCRKFNEKYPEVLHHARRLEGLAKSLGIHAAGVVTSPVPLTDLLPLETRNHGGERVIVTALDMYGAAARGLVKLDVLGLRTLTVVKDCLGAIKERHGVVVDLESDDFDLNDPKVLQGFTDHDFGGVFQYDTTSADAVCRGVVFESFEDVAAMTALNRPGTSRSGLATKFVERKKKPELVKKIDFHPKVSEITADTLGIIVYQEHVIKIFTDCAGFAPGTADSLRKTIAKKIGDETLGKEREKFIEGCKKHSGIDEKTAGKIMDAITFFGSYGFNKSHATEYGMIAYWCLHGQTRVFDWDAKEYTTLARAYRDGVDRIAVYDERSGRTVPGLVKKIVKTGTKAALKIRTISGRSLVCSADHPVLTDRGYVKAGDLVVGKHKLAAEKRVSPAKDPLVRRKIGAAAKEVARRKTPQQRRAQAAAAIASLTSKDRSRNSKRFWASRTPEQKLALTDPWVSAGGFKRVKIGRGPDGKCVASLGEAAVCSFLCRNNLDHEHQPPVGGRRADFLCKGVYVEFDGMGRSELYFERKFGDLPYVVVKSIREIETDLSFLLEADRISEGLEITFQDLESVTPKPPALMYDVCMESAPHNFLANNIVVHNCMWLKVFYPIEFYWALLKNEPDRQRIQQLSKDAKNRGINLLPPHVNFSTKDFAIDDSANAIRGSLVDIKGVGEKAAATIMENQPFKDFDDLFSRVERKSCNKGVISALARAGALDGMVPNVKWFVDNLDEFWKEVTRKKPRAERLEQFAAAAAAAPDYTEEERMVVSSAVNPLAFGKHPIDAYKKFMERAVGVPLEEMSDENYFKDFDGKGHYIAGVIVEVKYNQIGDFHTGELPSEGERARMFWGKRYANVNIEEASGKQNRVKFDHHIFDAFRPLIDKGVGTPVIAHVTASNFTQTLRANFAVDLEAYRAERDGVPKTLWEFLVAGKHPAATYRWKSDEAKKERTTNRKFKKSVGGAVFCGVVTHVQRKYDKRGGLMAIFGMLDASGFFVSVLCFASVWIQAKSVVKPGRLLKIALHKRPDRRTSVGWSCFYEGGQIKWLKKADIVLE